MRFIAAKTRQAVNVAGWRDGNAAVQIDDSRSRAKMKADAWYPQPPSR